jgi:hypothetical protein
MVGTALHEATQHWLMGRAEGLSEWDAQARGYMRLLKFYPWEDEADQFSDVRSLGNTILMLKEIMLMALWDDWELVKIADHGWAVEVPFAIYHVSLGAFTLAATGERCILATQGKIDLIMRNKRTGEIRCFDLKTTIMSEDLIESEYTWSGQQVGYGNVLQAMLGEDLMKFDVWYVVARFNASEPPQTIADAYPKSEDDVDDYWLAKIDRLERMKKYAESGWFPRRNGGCSSYQRACSCFEICPSRDTDLIKLWFLGIGAEPQQGYEPWVTLEL